ncbi:NHL repeat-containing protein [soil metagenome]
MIGAKLRFPHPKSARKNGLLAVSIAVGLLSAGCTRRDAGTAEDVQIIGTLGRQPGQFSQPRAVTITKRGTLVAIDRTGRMQTFSLASGEFIKQWFLPDYANGTPTGISTDPIDDTLWVADTHYGRVLHYNEDGTLLGKFGELGEGPGKFVFITDVVADPDGKTIWITDYGIKNRVIQFTRDGEYISEWGPEPYHNDELDRPSAVLLSPDAKSIYVVDTGNDRINIYDRAGNRIGRFGDAGSAPGQLKFPQDITLAPDNTLYIVEYGNSRISHFTLDGKFLGVWGHPGNKAGELFTPWGLAAAPTGELVIADRMNQRLQMLHHPTRDFTIDGPIIASSITTAEDNAP